MMGNQSLFTAILRPILQDESLQSNAKSIMQTERDMLASLPVAAVMTDERGCIQGFNSVCAFPSTLACLPDLVTRNCRQRR